MFKKKEENVFRLIANGIKHAKKRKPNWTILMISSHAIPVCHICIFVIYERTRKNDVSQSVSHSITIQLEDEYDRSNSQFYN